MLLSSTRSSSWRCEVWECWKMRDKWRPYLTYHEAYHSFYQLSQTSTHSISSHHRFVFYAQLNTRPLCLRWIQYLSLKNISVKNERPVDIRNRPRIPVPDEDPYSVAGSGSSGSSGVRERSKDKPPKLPPRDSIYGPQNIPKVRDRERERVRRLCIACAGPSSKQANKIKLYNGSAGS